MGAPSAGRPQRVVVFCRVLEFITSTTFVVSINAVAFHPSLATTADQDFPARDGDQMDHVNHHVTACGRPAGYAGWRSPSGRRRVTATHRK